VEETVPHDAAEHDTVQVTPLFAVSLVTVAVNCAVAPACSVAEFGVTATEIPGTVTVSEPETEGSLKEVAVNVTCRSFIG
jgi:hypothetical protein